MGDILRHAYENVHDDLIWITLKQELPPLRLSVQSALEQMERTAGPSLST